MLHTYIHTYIQTDILTEPPTKRVLEEHSLLKRKEKGWGQISNLMKLYTPLQIIL